MAMIKTIANESDIPFHAFTTQLWHYIINALRSSSAEHKNKASETVSSWGPFHQCFFHLNSKLVGVSFHHQLHLNKVIATKFCTWHDSSVVMASPKVYCDLLLSDDITARWSFHRIWIASKKKCEWNGPLFFIIYGSFCHVRNEWWWQIVYALTHNK